MREYHSRKLHGVGFPFVRTLPLPIRADERRAILLPFVHGQPHQVKQVLEYVAGLSEEDFQQEWKGVCGVFRKHRLAFTDLLATSYAMARQIGGVAIDHEERRLLAGAFFTMEYAFQAAALFNPSIVQHPDQANVPPGSVRFIMSFRAVGEGHISSVVFRTGIIDAEGNLAMDSLGDLDIPARARPDRAYFRDLFLRKLTEMGADAAWSGRLLERVPEQFTLNQLQEVISRIRDDPAINDLNATAQNTLKAALWLARSNYQIHLPPETPISELLIFPHAESESRGIEDMRLVRFLDDSTATYFGTYTAYDGSRMLPMLIETRDFHTLSVHTLNGKCAQNKGMALFPRKINGQFAMCSRIDGRNLFLMYSGNSQFWETASVLLEPKYSWEYRLMGNCGSPLETPEGWLLLTHGVGPMREYAIGAALLDLHDPAKIRGRLKDPLLVATDETRAGYVPNVVYSCGGMLWQNRLFLPYGIADERAALAQVELGPLLDQLISDGP
jgi:predicted GH43/DUF377 family glycosyl hydrolase